MCGVLYFRGKNPNEAVLLIYISVKQGNKAAISKAGLSVQQEPSRSNKSTYNESVYRDFIQF